MKQRQRQTSFCEPVWTTSNMLRLRGQSFSDSSTWTHQQVGGEREGGCKRWGGRSLQHDRPGSRSRQIHHITDAALTEWEHTHLLCSSVETGGTAAMTITLVFSAVSCMFVCYVCFPPGEILVSTTKACDTVSLTWDSFSTFLSSF